MIFCPRMHTNAPREIRKGCVVKYLKERASSAQSGISFKELFLLLRISYFDHIHPSTLPWSIPLSYPPSFVSSFFFEPMESNLCSLYTAGCGASHGGVVLKENRLSLSQQLSVTNSFLTCGGTLYLHPQLRADILSGLSCTSPVHAVITL